MKDIFDILITGSGFAGQALAHALAGKGLKVGIIERDKNPNAKITEDFDGRATTVSATSVDMLDVLDLWNKEKANPIKSIGIRQQGLLNSFGQHNQIDFKTTDVTPKVDAFGYVMENQYMRKMFLERTAKLQDITWYHGMEISGIAQHSHALQVECNHNQSFYTKLLVGADGGNSAVRKLAGLEPHRYRYSQNAIVASIAHELAHKDHADELYTTKGPFAVLPMTGNRSNIVISHQQRFAEMLMTQNHITFLDFIKRRIAGRLGNIETIGKRHSYPLYRLRTKKMTAHRIALIADAAHVIHPVAGQGLNLGFRDVAALGETIINALKTGQEIGSDAQLRSYENWRSFDVFALTAFTDLSHRIFDNAYPSLQLLRRLSLRTMQQSPALKQQFIKRAMGKIVNPPLLLEGKALVL